MRIQYNATVSGEVHVQQSDIEDCETVQEVIDLIHESAEICLEDNPPRVYVHGVEDLAEKLFSQRGQ